MNLQAIHSKLSAAINNPQFQYLYDRWQDEKEYEDFEDYKKAVAKLTGWEVVRATKRPFSFFVKLPDRPEAIYELNMTARCGRWRRV